MMKKEIILNANIALQAKTAAMFIQKASNYKSSIWLEKDAKKANAKSLLGVLAMKIGAGATITISAEGEDEESALNELETYLKIDAEEVK